MESKLPNRPLGATIMISVVLIFTSFNVLRTISAIQSWSFLGSLPLRIPVIYLAISGFFWASFGITLLIGLFLKKKWTLTLSIVLFIGYSLYYWLDRLFIAKIPLNDRQWQFPLILMIFTLIIGIWIVKDPNTKNYFNIQNNGAQYD